MPRSRVLQFGLMMAVMASGYGVMFTVLDDFRDEYGISASWLGGIVGIGFLASFFAQIFLAPIADRGFARRLVLGGSLLNIVGLVTMAFGETITVLLAGRFISGIGIGMAFPAIRRIVINGDPDNLGSNVGLLLSADVAGFAAGPALSALMVPTLGIPAPFFTIAALSLLVLPVVLTVEIVESDPTDAPAARFAFDLLADRRMVAALMLGAALFLMIGTFDALWVLVLDDLGANEVMANAGITFFALPLIFLGATGGRLAQRVGPFRLGTLGIGLGAVFIFLYGVMPVAWAMLAVGLVHATCDGLTASSTGVAVGMAVSGERQAAAQGMLGAVQTLTGGVTAVLAGVLYETSGRFVAYTVSALLMLALAAGALVLSGAYAAPMSGAGVAPETTTVTPHA
ncbi:MAG: MFS transporter [Ilumatobacteraceae bacterium]